MPPLSSTRVLLPVELIVYLPVPLLLNVNPPTSITLWSSVMIWLLFVVTPNEALSPATCGTLLPDQLEVGLLQLYDPPAVGCQVELTPTPMPSISEVSELTSANRYAEPPTGITSVVAPLAN